MEAGQTSSVTPRAARVSSSAGSSAARTPCPIRSAPRASRHARTLAGPSSSPPCGVRQQPAALGDAERRVEVVRPAAPLVVGQPETRRRPRPAYCTASRASVRASRGCRVRFAAMITPMPTPDASAAVARRVHHQLGERRQPAEPRAVPARVDLDLQPARPLRRLVLGRLADQPADVLLVAQHRTGDVVEPLEPEPAAFVGRAQAGRPFVDQSVGQVHVVLASQLDERRVPHRAGEVHMQMGLGQRGDRAGLHVEILPYAACRHVRLPEDRLARDRAGTARKKF